MSEWKEYKLGEIASFQTGKLNSNEAVENGLYPFFTCSPITLRINTYAYDQKAILLAGNNAEGNFSIKYYEGKFNAYQRTYIIKSNEEVGDLKFLFYSLKLCLQEFKNISQGTSTRFLTSAILNNLVISLPPLDEQKRIAGVLSSLDDKIDLLNRENATLEALAETLFRHYFIENPNPAWKEGKIADLVDFNPNRKLTKNEDSPYIEMANIETQGFAPSSWSMRPFASGTKFINGDAIMARISPCLENGKAAYIDFLEDGQVGWGSTEFLVMRSKMGLHPFFAYIMTRYDDFRDHAVSSLVGSSGRQRVDLDNLLKYSIFIPDEKAITRFNREMEMIVSKMRNNQLQMRTLAFQRDIILPRLMSGEVKVIGL